MEGLDTSLVTKDCMDKDNKAVKDSMDQDNKAIMEGLCQFSGNLGSLYIYLELQILRLQSVTVMDGPLS